MSWHDDVMSTLALGTGRRALEGDWPEAIDEFERANADRETELLTAAATCYVGQRMAWSIPAPATLPSLPPEDPRRPVGDAAHQRLVRLLAQSLGYRPEGMRPLVLLSEWMTLANARELRVRGEAVCRLLSVGNSVGNVIGKYDLRWQPAIAVREAIATAVGPLGEWLALLNEEWDWVTCVVDPRSMWDRGDRRDLTAAGLLRHDADALSLIEAAWDELGLPSQLAVIDRLPRENGSEVTAILDRAIHTRNDGVRNAARRMYLRLPDSERAGRCMERAARALVTVEPGGRIVVTVPLDDDPTLDDDSLGGTIPAHRQESVVARIVGSVPPSVWQQWTALPIDELLHWAGTNEWGGGFLSGWTLACGVFEDEAWAIELVRHDKVPKPWPVPVGHLSTEALDRLVARLPEASIRRLLSVARPLGPEASRRVLDFVAGDVHNMQRGFPLEALYLDLSVLPRFVAIVDDMQQWLGDPKNRGFVKSAEGALATLTMRAKMHEEFDLDEQ